jgi:hypothetical protein
MTPSRSNIPKRRPIVFILWCFGALLVSLLAVMGLLVMIIHEVHVEERGKHDVSNPRSPSNAKHTLGEGNTHEGGRSRSSSSSPQKVMNMDWVHRGSSIGDSIGKSHSGTGDKYERGEKETASGAGSVMDRGMVNNVSPRATPQKGQRPWSQSEEDRAEFAMRKLEPRIEILPTFIGGRRKTELKQDKQVHLHDDEVVPPFRDKSLLPSGVLGQTRSLLEAQAVLMKHPLYGSLYPTPGSAAGAPLRTGSPEALVDAMVALYNDPQCRMGNSPIYLTMASVGDELYWQLIENFIYSLAKFGLSGCSLVVCVSDAHCMELCQESYFPCFNYRESTVPLPSMMEQIGILKLAHIPKVLDRGVDLFMLDLDVGFLNDPRHMTKVFYETPTIDIFVQLDYLFIMNRSTIGWKQWFTEPLPNIGLFLCRGNSKVKKVFDHAWYKYSHMTDLKAKKNPGKDQNHVLDGIRIGRGTNGLRFAYFRNSSAALLDKIVQKWRGIELGGQPVAAFLEAQKTIAVHTTCYEQRTKVMGLKAVNGFWNPRYYDPLRPTITKQILFISEEQVRDEIRSLVWLAVATGRSLILPNLLGAPSHIPTTHIEHEGQAMWPGFRVAYMKRQKGSRRWYGGKVETMVRTMIDVELLEPAYYWRVERDYDDPPAPTLVPYRRGDTLTDLKKRIETLDTKNNANSRVVLSYVMDQSQRDTLPSGAVREEEEAAAHARVRAWSEHSVGNFEDTYDVEYRRYGQLQTVKAIRGHDGVDDVLKGMRTCKDVFARLRGNRTCFQVCD